MSGSDAGSRLIAHLSSLELGEASTIAAARSLARLGPGEAAYALDLVVRRAKHSGKAGHALAAVGRALSLAPAGALPAERRQEIYAQAVELGLTEVAALFVRDRPAAEMDPARPPPQDEVIGQLTLGHKKMLARRADSDRIARLAREGDARVIRELLLNPRLVEATVVRIAASRPVRVEALWEIWRSTRWSVRAMVRRALAKNPYTPPELALKILPHLAKADLKAIAADGTLHESVRQMAGRMVERGH